jgi:prepilin-type N-terminal cleavage/methylation domain-containing protein
MRKKFMRNPIRQGFTLIELVVAMAVFSLMMMLMMQFFTDTQKLWSRSEDKANMYADARVAMDLMSSALQSVYYQENSRAGETDNLQERFYIGAVADNSSDGKICFPVNLSMNSPLYPDSLRDNAFTQPFYVRFRLNNNTLYYTHDNGTTNFSSNTAPNNFATEEEVIGNVTHLSFRLFRGNFSVLNDGSDYAGQVFPFSVQITLKMMPKAAFKTWNEGGRDTNLQQFREENEYEFVRIIYLGVY